MSARAITAARVGLAEAREALGALAAAERVDALGAVLEAFRDPAGEPRRALERALPDAAGFSPAVVREGLEHALDGWTAGALRALVEDELGGLAALADGAPAPGGGALARGFETTAVVLAGALPTPSLLQVLLPLVLGSPVLVRPASGDPVTARVLGEALATAHPALGRALALVEFAHEDAAALDAFCTAPCVVATGSDATVARYAARVAPPQRFVGYGHRLSVAALGPEATRGPALDAAMHALARDVALWDQLGCLSPLALYVEVLDDPAAAARAAEALAHALERVESELPRGPIDGAAAAVFAAERAEAEFRAASSDAVALHADPKDRFAVVLEADPAPRAAPLHRFARVHPVHGAAGLLAALRPLAPHLAALGHAGFGPAAPALAPLAAALGASRLCPVGAMQAPPIGWCHDGQGLLRPLARLLATEGA